MIATPFNRAEELALEIYASVLSACRADILVESQVSLEQNRLHIQDLTIDLSRYERIFVCGAGKASVGMAEGLERVLGGRIFGGIVVTKRGHGRPLKRVVIRESGHPVPDEASISAGNQMLQFGETLTERDLVLFCLSGGASALIDVLVGDLDWQDLAKINLALLGSGAPIHEVNQVRTSLSKIKGGGLARAFAKATTVCLVLSDVIGDPLQSIGSGPFFPHAYFPIPLSKEIAEALPLPLQGLMGTLPSVAQDPVPHVEHRVLGNLPLVMAKAEQAASGMGLRVRTSANWITGEARDEGVRFAHEARRILDGREHDCYLAGGEPVVHLVGTGKGGRAQEFAVACAPLLHGRMDLAVLAGSTDGTDGPGTIAAGMVDGGSQARAKRKGVEAETCLRNNDSSRFLAASGGQVVTGPTQTNLNDLFIAIRA